MIKINSSTGLPVYLQIIEQVKRLIESGVLRPGDSLPSVRNLATQLVISPNTVIKAYTELEHQNVIDLFFSMMLLLLLLRRKKQNWNWRNMPI